MSDDRRQALAELNDRVWAQIESRLDDIKRIAYSMPVKTRDDKLVVSVLLAVAGFVHTRIAARIDADRPTPGQTGQDQPSFT